MAFKGKKQHEEHRLRAIFGPRETEPLARFDIIAKSFGGGVSGQAGAIRLALARAMQEYNFNWRRFFFFAFSRFFFLAGGRVGGLGGGRGEAKFYLFSSLARSLFCFFGFCRAGGRRGWFGKGGEGEHFSRAARFIFIFGARSGAVRRSGGQGGFGGLGVSGVGERGWGKGGSFERTGVGPGDFVWSSFLKSARLSGVHVFAGRLWGGFQGWLGMGPRKKLVANLEGRLEELAT